jgi:hypothetical protein
MKRMNISPDEIVRPINSVAKILVALATSASLSASFYRLDEPIQTLPIHRAFPDHEDAPSFAPQPVSHLLVAGHIGREFLHPKGSPCLRRVSKLAVRMPMPEAAVNEYNGTMLG